MNGADNPKGWDGEEARDRGATEPPGVSLRHAETIEELTKCYPVIVHLRPKITSASEWCERALEMRAAGYRVLACWAGNEVRAMAGYRVCVNLIHGRFLYVDDLVTGPEHRGYHLGGRLLEALSEIALVEDCARLVLDTSVTNVSAQRFYRRAGLVDVVVGFVKTIDRPMV